MIQTVLRRARRSAFIGLLLASAAAGALAQTVSTAPAAPASSGDAQADKIAALEAEVRVLAAEIQDLKAQTIAQIKDVRDKQPKPPAAAAVIASGKPAITSSDGKFTVNFHAVTQLDGGDFRQIATGPISTDLRRSGPALGSSATNVDLAHARQLKTGDVFRRARIGMDGTAFADWDYRVMFDFGGPSNGVENAGFLFEGWVQYSGLKPFKARVGAFAPSLGLDDQASVNSMPFQERAAVSDLSRNLVGGDSRTAAQIYAGDDRWLAAFAIAGRTVGSANSGTVLNIASTPTTSAIATAQSYGDQLGFTGRVAGTPIKGGDYLVHLGANASYVSTPASTSGPAANGLTPITSYTVALANTPELRVDGTKLINTGAIDAKHASTVGLEFAAQKQNFLLQSEYQHFTVNRSDIASNPTFDGYYVSGTWVITGERRTYNTQSGAFDAVPVAHPFDPKAGAWGAWELGLRYSNVDLNYHAGAAGAAPAIDAIRGGDEQNWTLGLNWYPNAISRVMLDYAQVKVDRLSPNAANYQTPTGAQIGQSYGVLSGRAQLAF